MTRSHRLRALGLVGGLVGTAALAQSVSPPSVPVGAYATPEQVQSAIQSAMPPAATVTPPATALDSSTGAAIAYARADHTHAARVQRVVVTTGADGTATWTFARPIAVASGKVPPVTYMVEDAGSPVIVQVTGRTFTSASGVDTHTAVTIKAQRSRVLPAALVSLSALLNFDVFGASGASVKVDLFAGDPTQ